MAGFAVCWLKPICLCVSPVFRTPSRHPSENKLRVDDYSVFGHIDATVILEKVSFGGLDVVVSTVRLLMQSFFVPGVFGHSCRRHSTDRRSL